MDNLNIYIDYISTDYKMILSNEICKRSILNFNKKFKIHKLDKNDYINIFDKYNIDEIYPYTKFLIPYINNYKGYSLYCNSTILFNCDIQELIDECMYIKTDENILIESNFHIACVKHIYNKYSESKISRKDWNSLILFNNERCKILTPRFFVYNNISDLNNLYWCKDVDILSIHKKFNYLVEYYDDIKDDDIKIFNFNTKDPSDEEVWFSDKWLYYITFSEKIKLKQKL